MTKYTNKTLTEYINNGHKGNPILLRFLSSRISSIGDDLWGEDNAFESLYRQLLRIYSKKSRIWAIPIPIKEIDILKQKYNQTFSYYLYLQLDQWYIRPDQNNILFMTKIMNYPGEDYLFSGDNIIFPIIYYQMVAEDSEEYTKNIINK
jgi:hypothetical protein